MRKDAVTWHCCQESEQANQLQCGKEIHLPGKQNSDTSIPDIRCNQCNRSSEIRAQRWHDLEDKTYSNSALSLLPAHLQPEVDVDDEEGGEARMEAHGVDEGKPRGRQTLEVHAQSNELGS